MDNVEIFEGAIVQEVRGERFVESILVELPDTGRSNIGWVSPPRMTDKHKPGIEPVSYPTFAGETLRLEGKG